MPLSNLLNPKAYTAFRQLEVLAHRVVEGFVTGLHKSPFKGFAIEFDQHRQYVQGDDLKHLDWKLVAKSNRYYIKQYEEDTSLRAHLLLDTSASMKYTSQRFTKLDYGRFIVGVFTYLLTQQKDSIGLATFDETINHYLTPRSTTQHMKNIMDTINTLEAGNDTGLGSVLQTLAAKFTRRSLIIIISDFFDDPEDLILALNHFAHKKHEVIVYQVLDRNEAEFPFQDLTRFENLEGEDFQLTDPIRIRQEYLKQFNAHQQKIQQACHQLRIEFTQLFTDQPFERTVAHYLSRRMKR